MTVPMWAPFAFLAGVCCAYPAPRWARRVDWPVLAAVVVALSLWPIIGLLVWWLVW